MYPSLMKMLPCVSHATIGRLGGTARQIAGSGGFGCFHGSDFSSEASFLRPRTPWSRAPSGLKRMIMSVPLSIAQMLSSLSIRTSCAERPRIQPLADLANKLAVRPELQQLRSRSPVSRSHGVAAIVNKNVLFRNSTQFPRPRRDTYPAAASEHSELSQTESQAHPRPTPPQRSDSPAQLKQMVSK